MFTNKHLRLATDAEQQFYEQALYPLQDDVLALVSSDCFYLSGGTALSRFYYDHHYSDDLDFFFRGDAFSRDEFFVAYRAVVARLARSFRVEVTIDGELFKRLFVRRGEIELKIEFIFENYPHIGEYEAKSGYLVDSRENLATNKITAVQDLKTVKDFVDLYFLLKNFDFEQLIRNAALKIVPLDYEGTVLAFGDTMPEGVVLMKRPLEVLALNTFSRSLITRLIDHARQSG